MLSMKKVLPIGHKVWADFGYLNSVVLLFLSLYNEIQNTKAVFFALIFNHMISELPEEVRWNLDSYDYFLNQNRTYNLFDVKRRCKTINF